MRTQATLTILVGTLLLVGCENTDSTGVLVPDETSGTARPSASSVTGTNAQLAAIHELQSAFHGALRNSDSEAIGELWTEDATLQVGPTSATGPDAIAAFFQASPPFVNGWAALAPTYKTRVTIHGNRAEYGFECVYVAEPSNGMLAGNSVVAHLNATGVMRKVGDRWLFESFVGGVGPLP